VSWNSLQELIGRLQVPAFFTDYCEEAGVMAGQAIAFFTNSPLTFPVGFAISVVEGFSLQHSNCIKFNTLVGGAYFVTMRMTHFEVDLPTKVGGIFK
jgi:hypothetical protein